MTKLEFMSELENLLLDIPIEERVAALEFYEDYFEDAGPDNVDDVIKHFGSPSKVAKIIMSDMERTDKSKQEDILYTETGYKDLSVEEDRYEVARDEDLEQDGEKNQKYSQQGAQHNAGSERENWNTNNQSAQNRYSQNGNYREDGYRDDRYYQRQENSGNKVLKIIGIIFLCLLAVPVGIPLIATAFALFIAGLAVVFSLFLALFIVAVAMLGVGIVLVIGGIYMLAQIPIDGILMCGAGLITFGFGLLFTMLLVVVCVKVLPGMFRGIINLCRLPFHRNSKA